MLSGTDIRENLPLILDDVQLNIFYVLNWMQRSP
jgi:hypothetical protein